ncbi:PQQ-like beta-propeller repeat protein [bacterium]|nr:PQQ-like beta-propeller repeat protein [bacterium]
MKNLLLFASLSALLSFSASADDWPNFQGPDRLGISSETGLNLKWGDNQPPVLWEKELNEGFGGAAIVGDEVFLVDRDIGETDKLLSLSLKDGSENWSFSFDFPGKLSFHGSRGVPLVEDDAVYFISGFGQVFRINRETHKQDWMVPFREKYGVEEGTPKWGWAQSPVVVGDILIVPAHGEKVGLVGLHKKTIPEKIAPPTDSNRCTCRILAKAPRVISPTKQFGRSNSDILLFNFCRMARCRAYQVTVSPSSIKPLVLPAIGRSPVPPVNAVCASMLRARSKNQYPGRSTSPR